MNQPLQLDVEQCGSVSPVCRYVLTIISVKVLHKFEETLDVEFNSHVADQRYEYDVRSMVLSL